MQEEGGGRKQDGDQSIRAASFDSSSYFSFISGKQRQQKVGHASELKIAKMINVQSGTSETLQLKIEADTDDDDCEHK